MKLHRILVIESPGSGKSTFFRKLRDKPTVQKYKYQWRSENADVPLMHEKRTGHVSLMTKENWLSKQ